jgi:uncharacterized membrane protein
LLIGSLVPLDARAKQALIVVGIVLLVIGALVMLFRVDEVSDAIAVGVVLAARIGSDGMGGVVCTNSTLQVTGDSDS